MIIAAVPAALFLASTIPATAEVGLPAGSAADATADIVAGIVLYSRWPQPRPVIRLCVLGRSAMAGGISARRLADGRRIDVDSSGTISFDDCDIIYMAAQPAAVQARISRGAVGHATLTITDNDPMCDSGVMACLRRAGDHIAFDLNLDAASRSTVRIDPRVLSLAGRRRIAP
jgi:hypothetical protein